MSQTYVQITHHHAEKLSKTNPNFIGINYTPFPSPSIFPETSVLQADDIPRCSYCSAFFNKFNKYDATTFTCSLCGSTNRFKTPNIYSIPNPNPTNSNIYIPTFNGCTNFGGTNAFDNSGVNSAECKYEVYDAIAKDKFKSRQTNFVPTTFFYISLSLMKSNPEIFNCIDLHLQQCFQLRQFAICFLHGALTLVKLRPSPEFQTYFDDAPECRSPLYYVSAPNFRYKFQTIINKASELAYVEAAYEDEYCKNVIEHSKKISLLFGTNVYYIFDEKDFNLFSSEANKDLMNSASLQMVKRNVQASVIVFASQNRISNFPYKNPLLDFSAITGGIFKIFPQMSFNLNTINSYQNVDNNVSSMYNEFLDVLNFPSFHDTFIFVCPPANGPLSDFAGQGMMKSHTGISTSKIKYNDSFSFKFDPSDADDNPYIQIVVYFTTNDNVRKMRVTTVPILKCQAINLNAQIDFCSTFVAQRFLIEGREQAQKLLDSLKKAFTGISFQLPELIINNQNNIQADQLALFAFNKTLYGQKSAKNSANLPSQNQIISPPPQQQQVQPQMQDQQQHFYSQQLQQQQIYNQQLQLQQQQLYNQQYQQQQIYQQQINQTQQQQLYNQQYQQQQIYQQQINQTQQQLYSQQLYQQPFQQTEQQQQFYNQQMQRPEPQQQIYQQQIEQQPQFYNQQPQFQQPEQQVYQQQTEQQNQEQSNQPEPQKKNYKFA
ncbi:hypothetical protein M9Y10_005863 [Tritrichomonas musculus]|uniref:Zinc finger Sec23/Sec24-type domain-containing protein n=1 Tax=Tritrichomonas musculus TaxID=1915356 RepID=A0ABR2JDU0_9EUKA